MPLTAEAATIAKEQPEGSTWLGQQLLSLLKGESAVDRSNRDAGSDFQQCLSPERSYREPFTTELGAWGRGPCTGVCVGSRLAPLHSPQCLESVLGRAAAATKQFRLIIFSAFSRESVSGKDAYFT